MLAQALNECLSESTKAGTPLSLTTFIVGRNRMENEGAIFLSEFFKVWFFIYLLLNFKVLSFSSICIGCWNFRSS